MWTTNPGALIGAQCEYANPPVNSITDGVLIPYLRDGYHCAIGDSNPAFGGGEHCGQCYRLTGPAGSAVVSVSNGGAGGDSHFDCMLTSFQKITGMSTGVVDISYEPVHCDEVQGAPTIINWADQNAYYCKMMIENVGGSGVIDSVRSCVGEQCNELSRAGGATWTGCPQGTADSVSFTLRQSGRGDVTCNCYSSWPWPTG